MPSRSTCARERLDNFIWVTAVNIMCCSISVYAFFGPGNSSLFLYLPCLMSEVAVRCCRVRVLYCSCCKTGELCLYLPPEPIACSYQTTELKTVADASFTADACLAQVGVDARSPRRFFSFFGNVAGCLFIVWLVDETIVFRSTLMRHSQMKSSCQLHDCQCSCYGFCITCLKYCTCLEEIFFWLK